MLGSISAIASLVLALLIARFQFVPLVGLVIWIALVAVAWRPRIGLYTAFGLVLMFETGTPDPLMAPGQYLFGTGFGAALGIQGTLLTPLEILLLLVFSSWLLHGIAVRRLEFRGGRLGWPMTLFTLALVGGLAWGIVSGGDAYIAFWEARALFYLLICFLVAANTIRTRGHLKTLIALFLIAVGIYAIEGAYRYLALIRTDMLAVPQELAYGHDTVVFLGTLILVVIAQRVFGAPGWQLALGPPVAAVTLLTMLAAQRRAGYIALLIAFIALALVLVFAHRKAFLLIAVPLLLVTAAYMPAFWNDSGLLGQPARAVRSLSEPDARDASSNEYRVIERYNVIVTLQSNPILGVGFGQPFQFAAPLPDLSWWPFWHYEPHHNILWVWLKTGAIGFALFWLLMTTGLARAAHLAKTVRIPETRVFAVLSLVSIIATLVFCYVDLGLVDGRITVFLGTILGTLSVLDRIS
jgi:hypothetical protein